MTSETYCEVCGERGEHEHEAVVIREGASLRTGDELALVFLEDAMSLGAELSVWGHEVYSNATAALYATQSPSRWLEDDQLRDDLNDVVRQVEDTELSDYCVDWNDGYVIYRYDPS